MILYYRRKLNRFLLAYLFLALYIAAVIYKKEFETLKARLGHDKKEDIMNHKEELKHMLEGEIVTRYYFMRGRIAQGLTHDADLEKVVYMMEHKSDYQALLQAKK